MSRSSPIQPQLLSRINEALLLHAIRQHGPSTRGELSQHMGVSFPTVAKAVSTLLDARLLEEFDDEVTGPGRPAKRLRLSKERTQVVGMTVDVTACEIAAAGFDGALIEGSRATFDTPTSYDALLQAIANQIDRLAGEGAAILSIGISVVGLVDYRQQEIRLAANLPFLNGRPLGRDLGRRVGAECVLVHDAHALCLAEYVYGRASGVDSFAMLDMSTGIGLGLMIDNRCLAGHNGYAGEMGHIPMVAGGERCRCGRRGCLETLASEWALVARVSQALGREVGFDELLALALHDDRQVRRELDRASQYLAMALAQVVNLFDPQCVYLNGRLFQELPWFRDQLVEQTKQLALEPAAAECSFLAASGTHLLGAVATGISAVTAARVHELHDTLSGITFSMTGGTIN